MATGYAHGKSPDATKKGRVFFLGVDVGTGSARAGIFDCNGKLLGVSSSPLQIWKEADCVEQSSTDIWHAVCAAVKSACKIAGVIGSEICGIGFAATCSLVALGPDDSPVTVSWSGDARRNVIVWMDHRAVDQAERINATGSPVLQYAGGSLSPEMEPPKLLWVKENLQESWAITFRWMDLSDWLTYRATGDDTRSLCTTVCKWTYLGHAHMQQMTGAESIAMEACGWDDVFWQEIGLGDLVEGQFAKIGRNVASPGHPLGTGLTALAAKELGLLEGTPVGTSLIDAHAGGVGVMEGVHRSTILTQAASDLSLSHDEETRMNPNQVSSVPSSELHVTCEKLDADVALCHRMVLVCGTSTCHMAVSQKRLFIPGVWGPYWSAMVPGFWLTEGGQSATGALLDHIIENHAAAPLLANRAASQRISIFELLNGILEKLAADPAVPFLGALTKDLHVLPDFHGNRSPLADPKARGAICGLTLDSTEVSLAVLYLAAIQSIAYGTRHIVEHCNANGLTRKQRIRGSALKLPIRSVPQNSTLMKRLRTLVWRLAISKRLLQLGIEETCDFYWKSNCA
ncbi:hypothetical protein O6H91_11G004900 [Diphasiastrum complanatum]|uniref:Uncharacterized protein n=1 Tax=Diphasiastrum complanatum TaxID=34168 RepID=A0ACC2C5U1_DIPCM|nr:hypothetical protein O6H91_11G004900 [Diphasiastrum complanatum]